MLDVGSNSAQLQVVDAYPGAPPLPSHTVKVPTKLGQAFNANGEIDDAGVERVVRAVVRAMRAARQFVVEQLFAFATSAVRDATNRDELLERINRRAGLHLQFLTGEDEARLTYLAVHRWYGWSAGRLLVVDIGGGSTEVALGRDVEPDVALSLPLGASRLTRSFLTDDPPTDKQLKALRREIRTCLRDVSDRLRWEGPPSTAVATSKTLKQLARLAGEPPQRNGPFVPRALTKKDVGQWLPRLAGITARQRATLRGVSKPRARQIVAGTMVAEEAMAALGLSELQICPWALREGVILHYLQSSMETSQPLPLQPITTLLSRSEGVSVHALSTHTVEPTA